MDATTPLARAVPTTPAATSLPRFSRAFFFATRDPIFRTSQPITAFLRVLMPGICPGQRCTNHQDGADHPDSDQLAPLLA